MNILYIANIRLPTEKAHGIQIMKMCEAFARLGILVELVVPWRFNKIKENPFEYYDIEQIFKITKVPSLDLVKLGPLGFWIQTISFAEAVSWYALFKKIDVIYSRDELPLWFLSFSKNNLVWEMHTPRYNFVIKSLLKRLVSSVAISSGLKSFYTNKGVLEESIIVQHDGVDTEQFSVISTDRARDILNLPKNKKIIGYVGKYKTMSKAKGVDELIESFREVNRELPETLLLLVGINKEEIKEVIKKLESVGLGKETYHIVGHIPQKKVPPYLSACDVLVMNYPNAEHYTLYMSPLKLFEYMAVERPIIATDLPVVREILSEDNAYLVTPGDMSALTESIKKVLNNQGNANIRARRARNEVMKYSWKKRAQNIALFITDKMVNV